MAPAENPLESMKQQPSLDINSLAELNKGLTALAEQVRNANLAGAATRFGFASGKADPEEVGYSVKQQMARSLGVPGIGIDENNVKVIRELFKSLSGPMGNVAAEMKMLKKELESVAASTLIKDVQKRIENYNKALRGVGPTDATIRLRRREQDLRKKESLMMQADEWREMYAEGTPARKMADRAIQKRVRSQVEGEEKSRQEAIIKTLEPENQSKYGRLLGSVLTRFQAGFAFGRGRTGIVPGGGAPAGIVGPEMGAGIGTGGPLSGAGRAAMAGFGGGGPTGSGAGFLTGVNGATGGIMGGLGSVLGMLNPYGMLGAMGGFAFNKAMEGYAMRGNIQRQFRQFGNIAGGDVMGGYWDAAKLGYGPEEAAQYRAMASRATYAAPGSGATELMPLQAATKYGVGPENILQTMGLMARSQGGMSPA